MYTCLEIKGFRRIFGMNRWIVEAGFVLCLTILAPGLFANPIPTCGVASLATYDSPGYECTLGDYTLEDFSFTTSETGGASLLTDSQILVDPTGSTPTTIEVAFSGDFSVADTGQSAEYVFQYELDPVLPTISSPTLNLGPNDPVTLTGEYCGNGMIFSAANTDPLTEPSCVGNDQSGIFPGKLQILGTGPSASLSYDFPQLVTTIDSRLILDLDGPSNVNSFSSVINVTGGGPSPVPEPSSALLLAPALLGFVLLRKKLSRRTGYGPSQS
jgi:hypothetical protein